MTIDDILPELQDKNWLASLSKDQAEQFRHSWQEQIDYRTELITLPFYGQSSDARGELFREIRQYQTALKTLLDYVDERKTH